MKNFTDFVYGDIKYSLDGAYMFSDNNNRYLKLVKCDMCFAIMKNGTVFTGKIMNLNADGHITFEKGFSTQVNNIIFLALDE